MVLIRSSAGTQQEPWASPMLMCSGSGPCPKFGDLCSGTDVLDEGVCWACEILPDCLHLVFAAWWLDPLCTTLVGAVLKTALSVLQPGYPCTMCLHKLNLYSPGSFFVGHIDMPCNCAMIGTVVVGLPLSHAGCHPCGHLVCAPVHQQG
jgi:hypothetical protein